MRGWISAAASYRRPVEIGAVMDAIAVGRVAASGDGRYAEGDHVIFVGEVERCTRSPGASPLLFHGGRFYTEHPL